MFCFPNRGSREIWPNFYSYEGMHVNKTKLEKNTSLHTVEYYKSHDLYWENITYNLKRFIICLNHMFPQV